MTREMTVTQLSSYLKGVFDDEELLHDVTLSGEVAEVSYSDKHTFIVLAEGDCSVRCVRFFSRDAIEKGTRVALRGSVRFYDKRNTVSFVYSEFFVCGAGAKNAALAALKEKLKKAGLFEDRPQLPRYVLDVIAVTSPDGAAIRDFVRVVHGKCPFVRISVYPVKVQGVGAANAMAVAVKRLQGAADAIVLCRGGGSDEDLDAFNDEALATAVAMSKTPVISAVGHEVDYTLCDFCAGTRAGTPSIAGQIVAAHASALIDDIVGLMARADAAVQKRLDAASVRLTRFGDRLVGAVDARTRDDIHAVETAVRAGYHALDKRLAAARHAFDGAAGSLSDAAERAVAAKAMRLEKLSAVLSALDPHRIKPGMAAVYLDGKSIAGAAAIKPGDELRLVLSDGDATVRVTGVKLKK